MYYESALKAEAVAQSIADLTRQEYMVLHEVHRPYRFTYMLRHDRNLPFTLGHWCNVYPKGEADAL